MINFETLLDKGSMKIINAIRKTKAWYFKIVNKSYMAKGALVEIVKESEKGNLKDYILKLMYIYLFLFVIVDFIFIYPCWKIIQYLEVHNPKV